MSIKTDRKQLEFVKEEFRKQFDTLITSCDGDLNITAVHTCVIDIEGEYGVEITIMYKPVKQLILDGSGGFIDGVEPIRIDLKERPIRCDIFVRKIARFIRGYLIYHIKSRFCILRRFTEKKNCFEHAEYCIQQYFIVPRNIEFECFVTKIDPYPIRTVSTSLGELRVGNPNSRIHYNIPMDPPSDTIYLGSISNFEWG
jgi:hypothetical protein